MTKTKTTTFSEVSTEALVQQFLVYITHSESLCQDPMTDIRHQMKAVQACTADQFAVGGRGPGVVVSAMPRPPLGQPLAGVRQRPLHHLQRGDPTGAAGGGEQPSPADYAALLLDGVEENERRVRDADDRGERRLVWVVDHDCTRGQAGRLSPYPAREPTIR